MSREERVKLLFDGSGGAVEEGTEKVPSGEEGGFSWLHLKRDHPATRAELERLELDEIVINALTAEETRPRCTAIGEGAVVNLRGVNLNPGAEPEDMVSVRLWVTKTAIVGVWMRQLKAVLDLRDRSLAGDAPASTGEFVAALATKLVDRASPVIEALSERIDALEELTLVGDATPKPNELADTRRTATRISRYLFPQRQALETLASAKLDWLTDRDRSLLKEAADKVVRLAEELDAIRDRAQVIYDEVQDRRAASMNQHTFVLSVVGAIFLPLGFLTGLLGINVGGIPGTENDTAFWIVCGLLLLIAGLLIWVFRQIGMLR